MTCININFWHNPIYRRSKTILFIWMVTAIGTCVAKMIIGKFNNYKIFEGVFHHASQGLSLYAEYPAEYYDTNYCGIIFSLLIAPFAILPQWLGMILWVMANTALLFYAIRKLPLRHEKKVIIYWVVYIELITAQLMQQFNISVAALIILSFVLIEKRKDLWAVFMILLGAFVKIYTFAGFAFFFFSKRKLCFVLSCVFWTCILLYLPVLIYGSDYVISQNLEWFTSLISKNAKNAFAVSQNISLLGLVRKVSGLHYYSDLWLIIPGFILFFIPCLRIKQYKNIAFRMMLLANALLFIVLFSTGSEASGYVIAMLGVGIWYVCSPSSHKKSNDILLAVTVIVVAISTTELVPAIIRREFITPFVTKSWFCVIVWLKIGYEMMFLDFKQSDSLENTNNISLSYNHINL